MITRDCFDLSSLPASDRTDAPQFNLIITSCAQPHLFKVKDFRLSIHAQLRDAAFVESAMLCSVRDGRLLSDPMGEIPSV